MAKHKEYQVIARKYRPQTFGEIRGQDAVVQTLKNAIRLKRTAHAYLFCGARGTGKTSIARILAKALNCTSVSDDLEPCNICSSCKEITSGHSLDVIEIDGASNRGIEDIRQINETVGYSSSGRYRIYIIDEVHMLTKEAFNALLKTLEEPPGNVKFFFATTEVHKIPPTILSRCQRFNLGRIPSETIIEKLSQICKDGGFEVEEDAMRFIASIADGGLRDAESLLDQILSFSSDKISYKAVCDILGILPNDRLFLLAEAGKEQRLTYAFELAEEVFSQGKDVSYFLDTLLDHFRHILLLKVSGGKGLLLMRSEREHQEYLKAAKYYDQEQCLHILDLLIETQKTLKVSASRRTILEVLLCNILKSHQRVALSTWIQKIEDLSRQINTTPVQKVEKSVVVPPKTEEKKQKKVQTEEKKENNYSDTLLQFAAVELEGTVKKD